MLRKCLLAVATIAACTFIPSSHASPVPAPAPSLPSEIQEFFNKRAGTGDPVIYACTVPNSFAVTFDDGPGTYTNELLDYLARRQVKVTFFVNGLNYNNIEDPDISATVQRAYREGHQIASHTWSHADISLPSTNLRDEMGKLDVVLKNLTGKRPVYMRPPYGNTSPEAVAWLTSEGYKIINWNVDTNDWQHPLAWRTNLQAYKDALQTDTSGKTFISLQHDAEPGTAQVFSKIAIEYVLSKGFNVMPVGACLSDTTGWYRD
ncbi:chitin deacetylase [Linnemannia gamsii]|uniref:Chitin deacetylase n=1 Tax=Linnemannia gamsii TaxID=64522 RepID=A0ABQ7K383_9FUNG|nr:chitin deacetylase [Linnemannia gamsii]